MSMRRTTYPWRYLTGAAVGAAVLSGCMNDARADAQVPADIAVYASTQVGVGGDAAQLQGTLTRDDGCTYVIDADGTRWLPIFASTSIASSDGTLTYGEDRYIYGEDVALTGGEGTLLDSDTVPDSCSTDMLWRVAQPS